ncbi:translation initiation factor IF-3 [Candidatus Kaiserbacteria bacterium]|nr:translation initiation factor IF-3 [Candidatus Kaiserbacteria bacterium]
MRRGPRKFAQSGPQVRINQAIRARELRVIGPEGENLGTLSTRDALKKAEELKLDLIEISPNANPPVAKITDYGQYRYETKRKAAKAKQSAHVTETKSVQVKIGTGEHDQALKAKRAAEWLKEGHRVKVDLFLWGRYKYMEGNFLKEKLDHFIRLIPADYKIADDIKKSPKGFSVTLERVGKSSKKDEPRIIEEEKKPKKHKADEPAKTEKSKKRSLDELLDIEGGLI